MERAAVIGAGTRVIEVGATGPVTFEALAAAGCERYLGLVDPARLDEVRATAGEAAARFQPLLDASAAVRNSTDVLLLRGRHARHLWRFRDLHHVRHVVLDRAAAGRADRVLATVAGRVAGKVKPVGRITLCDEELDVLEVRTDPVPNPRHYLSPVWGVGGLAARLEQAGVRWAVLRWFEGLPEIAPGEDLDVLVADDDLATFRAVLAEEPGTMPIDLYSESGLEGADWGGVAYYPPALARQVLARAERHRSGCLVPAPADHLRTLAYHAAYHKGELSGLPSDVLGTRHPTPEHDYAEVLAGLASAQGIDLPATLEGVDEHLAAEGWRPPVDTLLRLSSANRWIRARFFPDGVAAVEPPETAVFLVRERALDVLDLDDVLGLLERVGFEVLESRLLTDDARARCAAEARGGNWGRGPYAVSGGPPAAAIVAVHHAPTPVEPALRGQYPRLTNADILMVKRELRDLVRDRLPADEQFNPLHSSDNELEAWEYVELAVPDAADRLRADVDARRAAYRTDLPVVAVLSEGRRAKVEVVDVEGSTAVRKTFAPGYPRHHAREREGARALAGLPAIPELLAEGPNWLLFRRYDDTLAQRWSRHRLVPLDVLAAMVETIHQIHDAGYGLVDAKPENFLLDPARGLKVVDLEFLHRYEGEPPPFERSYSFVGVPPGFTGDLPLGPLSYDDKWLPWTGMPLEVLLHGRPIVQRLHRLRFALWAASVGPHSRARAVARRAKAAAPGLRARVTGRYAAWARRRADATA